MRRVALATAGLLLPALLAPTVATAQETIYPGDVRHGSLSYGDPMADGSYFDEYLIQVSSPQTIVVSLSSQDIDSYLRLYSMNGSQVAYNDDGGSGFDSRMEYYVGSPGLYRIRVTSFGDGETGSYRLETVGQGGGGNQYRAPSGLRVGDSHMGSLDRYDPVWEGDHYDDYVIQAQGGQPLRIELTSTDFDSYLYVGQGVGGGFRVMERNDDGGDGTNAALTWTPPYSGEFTIRASSWSQGSTGSYRLAVWEAGAAGNYGGGGGAAGSIQPGQTLHGSLSAGDAQADGKYYDDYTFYAQGGTTYTIHMPASGLDTYLRVGRGTGYGFSQLASNDDGGEGLDARMTWTAPSSGQYTIRATSYGTSATGSYSLSLSSGSTGGNPGRLETSDARDSNGRLYDNWTYQGQAGETIEIAVNSSEFDPVVELYWSTNAGYIARDDDGGDGLNSLLRHTLPYTGTYTIRVLSYGGSGTGAYTLTIR